MIKLKHIAFLIIGAAVLTFCTKPFDTESFAFDKVIVVDGQVTDQDKMHEVRLSYTYPIGNDEGAPLSGAEVWVETGNGTKLDFQESEAGTYLSTTSFAGEAGVSYQLFFTTSEGKNYRSTAVELIKSPVIDSIYDSYAEITSDESTYSIPGIQFFVDTHDPTNKAKYFRYEWEEDYQIRSPYPSGYGYVAENDSIYYRTEPIHICYESGKSSTIILGTTVGSNENRLIEFPVSFVSGLSDKLRTRYAINVRQYAVTESIYGFYRKLKESNESGGSLFDKQQGTITGNIQSIDDPGETILGIFEVAGYSELRTFFSFSDLDSRLKRPGFRFSCFSNDIVNPTRDSVGYWVTQGDLNIIDFYEYPEGESFITMGSRTCTECIYYATTQKPEYWID